MRSKITRIYGELRFLEDEIIDACRTRRDRAAIGAGVAFVAILAELLTMNGPPEPDWWVDTFVKFARPIEGENNSHKPLSGCPLEGQWSGPLWRFVEEYIPPGAVRDVVGIRRGAISGNMKVSIQAARSIG